MCRICKARIIFQVAKWWDQWGHVLRVFQSNVTLVVYVLIKDTPKEDKPLNKGQAESTFVYIIHTLQKITSERGQPLY